MNNDTAESPINVLLPRFENAPFDLAPERADELRSIYAERNIQIQRDPETQTFRLEGAELFGGLGLIYVGVKTLERLWAYAYGATHVYRQFQATGFSVPFNLRSSEAGCLAAELMGWALEGELRSDPKLWPDDLPKPKADPDDEQHQLTNELFLGTAGFAVLHEIGHIVLRHSGTGLPRDLNYRFEFEADEWAYDWVLNRWRDFNSTGAHYARRSALVSSLFGLIGVMQVYRPRNVATAAHPNTVDRLLQFLTKHANEDSGLPVGLAWAVAGTTLHLHVSQVVEQPLPVMDDWRRYFTEIRRRLDR